MDKELVTEIENVLKTCRDRGRISMTKDTFLLTRKAIQEAEARGWLFQSNSYTYRLTPAGIEVMDAANQSSKILLANIINKQTKYNTAHTKPMLSKTEWVAVVLSIIASIVAIYQFFLS